MDITYEGTDIIVCVYIYVCYMYVLLYYYNYGGSHASDIIITCLNGSLRGITNHVLLCIMHICLTTKRSSSSSSSSTMGRT